MLYMREVLSDFAQGKLDTLSRVDIYLAIKSLLEKQLITPTDIRLLVLYISGYRVWELREVHVNVEERIVYTLAQIAEATGYTDERFVELMLNYYPRYRIIAPYLLRVMDKKGKELDAQTTE